MAKSRKMSPRDQFLSDLVEGLLRNLPRGSARVSNNFNSPGTAFVTFQPVEKHRKANDWNPHAARALAQVMFAAGDGVSPKRIRNYALWRDARGHYIIDFELPFLPSQLCGRPFSKQSGATVFLDVDGNVVVQ